MTGTAKIEVSYDRARMDLATIVPFVQASYWGKGRSPEDIRASIEGSFVTGLFEDGRQVAYARAMSDGVFSAFVYDLFVIENARGRGLGKQVTEALLAHPDLTRVRGWMLATRAAHDLYRPFGFDDVRPGRYMDMMREVAT